MPGATVRSHHVVYRTLSRRSRVWFGVHHHRVDQLAGTLGIVTGVLFATGVVPIG